MRMHFAYVLSTYLVQTHVSKANEQMNNNVSKKISQYLECVKFVDLQRGKWFITSYIMGLRVNLHDRFYF